MEFIKVKGIKEIFIIRNKNWKKSFRSWKRKRLKKKIKKKEIIPLKKEIINWFLFPEVFPIVKIKIKKFIISKKLEKKLIWKEKNRFISKQILKFPLKKIIKKFPLKKLKRRIFSLKKKFKKKKRISKKKFFLKKLKKRLLKKFKKKKHISKKKFILKKFEKLLLLRYYYLHWFCRLIKIFYFAKLKRLKIKKLKMSRYFKRRFLLFLKKKIFKKKKKIKLWKKLKGFKKNYISHKYYFKILDSEHTVPIDQISLKYTFYNTFYHFYSKSDNKLFFKNKKKKIFYKKHKNNKLFFKNFQNKEKIIKNFKIILKMKKLKLRKIKRKERWKIRKKLKKIKKNQKNSKKKKIFLRFKVLLKLEEKLEKGEWTINFKTLNFINVFENFLFISFLRKIFTSTIKNGKKGRSLKLADNCITNFKVFLKNKNFLNIMYFVFKKLQPVICNKFFFQGRKMIIIPGLFNTYKFDNKKIKFCVRILLSSISKINENILIDFLMKFLIFLI